MEVIETQKIARVPFVVASPDEATHTILRMLSTDPGRHVHLANAYTLALADKKPEYLKLLQEGTVFPDGKPITWFSWLYRQEPALRQVRGPQLFLDVMNKGRSYNATHFLLGSSEETLELMVSKLNRDFPGVIIAGTYSPPFRPLTELEYAEQDTMIRKSGASIVWVGLGTPKQDIESQRISQTLGVTTIAIGAAFAFAAGTLRVAPSWMQKYGLEWLYRLIKEPRRLWRRYFFGNLIFIAAALRPTKRHTHQHG